MIFVKKHPLDKSDRRLAALIVDISNESITLTAKVDHASLDTRDTASVAVTGSSGKRRLTAIVMEQSSRCLIVSYVNHRLTVIFEKERLVDNDKFKIVDKGRDNVFIEINQNTIKHLSTH